MIITPQKLKGLFDTYKNEFQQGFNELPNYFEKVATVRNSTGQQESYAWLNQYPSLSEWVGDRQLKSMLASMYILRNRKYEASISIPRTAFEDGPDITYPQLFREMGFAAKVHPDELIFSLLRLGTVTRCYDGANFFDTQHPVGITPTLNTYVSNYAAGIDNFWCLLDTNRPLKPLIFQTRRDYELVAMNDDQDEAAFSKDEYRFGVSARVAAGFGFWQQAYGSRQPLTQENFDSAFDAMMGFKNDYGRPLNIKPNLLVCGPSNRVAAEMIANCEIIPSAAGTASQHNHNYKAVEVLIVPWLD